MLDANGEAVDLGELCSGGSEAVPNPGVFTVPIKRREANTAVIDVVINGEHTFEMLLDTGASGTVLTPEMANVLAIEIQGTTQIATAGGVVKAYWGRVNTLATGGITKKDVDVVIAPNLPIGLLGQDFFGNYDLVVRKDTIEFHVRK
ncbi:putative aspartyl protease [Gloeocapsa sp. PCC 73106]|nr:putative aspartyl protease [Gloeocapsa sp. PCC 73106]